MHSSMIRVRKPSLETLLEADQALRKAVAKVPEERRAMESPGAPPRDEKQRAKVEARKAAREVAQEEAQEGVLKLQPSKRKEPHRLGNQISNCAGSTCRENARRVKTATSTTRRSAPLTRKEFVSMATIARTTMSSRKQLPQERQKMRQSRKWQPRQGQ